MNKNPTHRRFIVTGAQILTVLGLAAGILHNYLTGNTNDTAIKGANTWMAAAIKEQTQEIKCLQISNAVLSTEIHNLKEFYLNSK